ncbi:MAG: winged helix-turn-helix domain-containing protein [Myxococcales bacterium]|nr:winged helix-turn-helix domain-containing protein [Myxococcales bacterium]
MMLHLDACQVDLERGTVIRDGQPTRLTTKELELLRYLVANPHRDLPRAELLTRVWGYRAASRTVDTTMKTLRRKVEADPSQPVHLLTIHGTGYRLALPERPAADRFVGRREEVAAIEAALRPEGALLVLVGTAGAGKTRLARETTGSGDAWIHLGEITDADGVLLELATQADATLDATRPPMSQIDDVGTALRRFRVVVLDEVEGVTAPLESLLPRLRRAAGSVRWLLTTRQRLCPDEPELPIGGLPDDEGTLLFHDRSGTDEDATELVRRLDGLPLAIELAAARANLMSTAQLRDRLGRRFDVLRQRSRDRSQRRATMEGALDWSWELLEPWEQDALAQCSVFRASFSLDAAEAVIDLSPHEDAPPVLDALQALRDKSLLVRVEDEPGRLTTYQTIRDYGARRLAEDPAGQRAAELRHARHFASFGERNVRESLGGRGPDALYDLAADLDNLLAVAERALEREAPTVEELDAALHGVVAVNAVFSTRGPAHGHRELLEALLGRVEGQAVDPIALSRALRARGLALAARGAVARGREDVERAVELAGDDATERGRALLDLAWTHLRERDLDRVEALCAEALELARRTKERQLEGIALGALGQVPKERGDDALAAKHYREALAIHREVENRWFEGQAHTRLGILYLEHGALGQAREHAEAALTSYREFSMRVGEALMLQLLGATTQLEGELEEARDCFTEAAAICAEVGDGRLLSTGLGYRAIAELELGDLEASRLHLEEACRVATEVGEHWHGALFRGYLGALEALEGRPERATPHFERAREGLASFPHAKIEASVLVLAALPEVTRAARGEPEAREAAREKIEVALAPRATLSDPEGSSADVRIALRIVRHAMNALDEAGESEDALRVDPSGAWFEAPGGARVDCRRRQALRRILVRLARQRVQQPGTPIPADALIAAGWPDERMSTASAQNRLYVTINRLRQLGLGEHLQLVEGGYRLDPDLAIALVPE